MDDPLTQSPDPLDELGGLVGETLNLFDAPVNPGSASRSPAQALPAQHSDSPGFASAALGTRSPDAVAQSIDLDLLGAGPAGTSSLPRAATGAPEVDVPLVGEDDVQLGFGYEPPSQPAQPSFGAGPLGERAVAGCLFCCTAVGRHNTRLRSSFQQRPFPASPALELLHSLTRYLRALNITA
mgnify:CR=1 FL=1